MGKLLTIRLTAVSFFFGCADGGYLAFAAATQMRSAPQGGYILVYTTAYGIEGYNAQDVKHGWSGTPKFQPALYSIVYYAMRKHCLRIAPMLRRTFCAAAMLQACAWLVIALACGNSQAQSVPLRIVGVDGKTVEVAAEQWQALPRTSIEAVDHGGAKVTFEGVPAVELLKLAGAPLGAALRGENTAVYVVAEGADGYKAVYALTEFDSGFTDRVIVVADRRSGEALASKEGPLRVVVPWEKRQARWVRQLVALRIERAK